MIAAPPRRDRDAVSGCNREVQLAAETRLDGDALINEIVRYYSETGQDYHAWSKSFHMHFGYYRTGLNPLCRESMLEEMSLQVLARLALSGEQRRHVLDMGCGLGATTRLAATTYPVWRIDGVTIVPWQLEHARLLSAGLADTERVQFVKGSYTNTSFPDATYDGAFAIESACHDAGYDKQGFIREAARLLNHGGRLVVADGFQKGLQPMSLLMRWIFQKVCKNWALECFAERDCFLEGLKNEGFVIERVEDASYRIAPSVAHIPWVTGRFLFSQLRSSRLALGRIRWRHILACVLAPILGLARSRFSYYIITARKK